MPSKKLLYSLAQEREVHRKAEKFVHDFENNNSESINDEAYSFGKDLLNVFADNENEAQGIGVVVDKYKHTDKDKSLKQYGLILFLEIFYGIRAYFEGYTIGDHQKRFGAILKEAMNADPELVNDIYKEILGQIDTAGDSDLSD